MKLGDAAHKKRYGITLLEIIFALALVVLLTSSVAFVYTVVLRSWDQIGHRSDLHERLYFALERVIRDARTANALSVANHSLRFTVNENGADQSYIYYLYNSSDSWVPQYSQAAYDLMRTSLTGGIGGSFTYGSGEIVVKSLKPPSADTTITSSGNVVFINLVGKEKNDTMKVRGYVRPRNIL